MFCTQCGQQNPDDANFCAKCGGTLAPAPYAEFWPRVGGYLIDQLVIFGIYIAATMIILFATIGTVTAREPPVAYFVSVFAVYVIAPWLYAALFESGPRQATLGKLALHIKVTDLSGNRISFARATGRYFAEWITGWTFLVGYIIAAFTRRRQALHDLIAGTLVVREAAETSAIAALPTSSPRSGLATAGIIAGCVLGAMVPLGILAAIAIPAYQDYTIRAQVTEGLTLAADFKPAVDAYQLEAGEWPASVGEMGLDEESRQAITSARYVDAIEVSNGTIVITYGGAAHDSIRHRRLALRPLFSDNDDIYWQCGRASGPPGADSDAGIVETSLPDKYLPASCRTGFVMSE